MVIYLRLATSEVSDHRGEDEGEGGEGEGDELPAAVEPAVLPDLELLPAKIESIEYELVCWHNNSSSKFQPKLSLGISRNHYQTLRKGGNHLAERPHRL